MLENLLLTACNAINPNSMAESGFRQAPWFRFVSRYAVLILVLVVAGIHMWYRTRGMNSWKGGGFGMYADYHPVHGKLFIKARNPLKYPEGRATDLYAKDLMFNAKVYVAPYYIDKLKLEYLLLYGDNDYTIEVWHPVFNPDSCTFNMELVLER